MSDFDPRQIVDPEIEIKEEDLQWIQEDKQIDKKEVCSVCLDRKVNVVTSCNHYFHMNCLIQWKKRMKNACPYCKSGDLRKITFYCHHCTKSSFTYMFEAPSVRLLTHMRLLCRTCRETEPSLYQDCVTRNFSSVQDTITAQNSNKTSRSAAEVEIKTPKQSRESNSQRDTISSPNEEQGPETDNRMLIKIDY